MNHSLLDRFYRGECTPEEAQAVLRWFRSENLKPGQEQELRALWNEQAETPHLTHDAEALLGRIKAQLPQQEAPETPVLHMSQPRFWLKVAAVLLPLFLLAGLALYSLRPEPAAYVSVEAAPGVRKAVYLPDGSVVHLHAGSRVTFQKGFGGKKREIDLQGEAFFEVAKDRQRPFIVHTGAISTQALGTSFNIRYMAGEEAIAVSLATGVVQVERQAEKGRKQLLGRLTPGLQLAYHGASQEFAVAPFDRAEVLGWKEGVLTFRSADMDEVVRKLEQWYGVEIEVEAKGKPGKAWDYTGAYDNESLDKVLEGIGFVKGFTYKRTKKKVKIEFNQSQQDMRHAKE
ncbi:FecR domain-containing protein [Pontibacter sp. E15-1]|uniref:FecR family protein n=1 Tax=Pontibacter sp. E15-1 TaxID=2919918 RepID=UPI001F4F1132|nr:FecR family protein [Pontibacter sp. E15-1]MCJ8164051.1 FecR domain-containing protein [Pontibacter sp. E15-1]